MKFNNMSFLGNLLKQHQITFISLHYMAYLTKTIKLIHVPDFVTIETIFYKQVEDF